MADALLNALFAGMVAAIGNLVMWLIFYRRYQEVRDLSARIRDLEDEGLGGVRKEIDHAKGQRQKIYERIERDMVSRRECREAREQESATLKQLDRRLDGMQAQLTELVGQSCGSQQKLDLIASRLRLDFQQ